MRKEVGLSEGENRFWIVFVELMWCILKAVYTNLSLSLSLSPPLSLSLYFIIPNGSDDTRKKILHKFIFVYFVVLIITVVTIVHTIFLELIISNGNPVTCRCDGTSHKKC